MDAASIERLRASLREQMAADRSLLDRLRDEIAPLRSQVRRIHARTTTAVSLVATDGGNNRLQFDPFLVQLVRIVDSNNNEYLRGDSRRPETFAILCDGPPFDCTITSPPYYGMTTYGPDQWLRAWFLGGPAAVEYRSEEQISHRSPAAFAADLTAVWRTVASVSAPDAHLVVRFGGINSRKADPVAVLLASFEGAGWTIEQIESAGAASRGRRQAAHFARPTPPPLEEHDVWLRLTG